MIESREITLHGHKVSYLTGGEGPVLVLVHGIASSSGAWGDVLPTLARRFTVLAPDLMGHGQSAKPRGDYSLGAYASGIRDLMIALGYEGATFVGHSLGGGVAMQLAYQFPERCERLVLISSGGLGHEVSPLLRSATLPGAAALLSIAAHPWVLSALRRTGSQLSRRGSSKGAAVQAVVRALRPLQEPGSRQAFLQTLRSVIDPRGQRVSAVDRLYLLETMPTLIVWGERDRTIPIAHGLAAHTAVSHSQFATLPRAAHFPHLEDPEGLASVLLEFLEQTEPAELSDEEWLGPVARRAPHTHRFRSRR